MSEFPKTENELLPGRPDFSLQTLLPGRPYFSLLFLAKWSLIRHICQALLRGTPQSSCVLSETVKVTKTLNPSQASLAQQLLRARIPAANCFEGQDCHQAQPKA